MTADHRPPRPKALLDAIEAEAPISFSGTVWRVVTDGFDPLRPGRSGGRWDDGTFDVLYTSSERDGALAEAWYHLSRGQPIVPSKINKRIHRIAVALDRVLDLSTGAKLASLGVNMAHYGRLSYRERTQEYPAPQEIAEVAFFHEYEAIIVPNARWPTSNVVVLTENARPEQLRALDSDPVDLASWAAAARARGD
ncbi:RES family NAD+ phosphorylase [Enterovirga rhinocerotis]|uniref:RES domain-containing protein n=1 Tax=Enterovirga rhinocerotis TaxID=1339210 RepID=A0A4V3DXU5_9HYPH|nr:RES family NAD+ phosphorylase [Enterovirga rhinocerotis]TDR89809.1 RES domain-containing protein [Enterovirga rhinocerotis]